MQEKMNENFISAAAVDKLIGAHDGDLALLYLYIRRSGCRDMEQAAYKLCRTLREMEAAEEKLQRMGLLDEAFPAPRAETPLPPAPELPQYKAEEIYQRSREDEQFSVILAEAGKIVGHALSSADLKTLFGIYDCLLPTEVILMLLNYMGEVYAERYGSGKRPTLRAIEKEAYAWANEEVLTLDRAESHIRKLKDRHSQLGRIRRTLGIQEREFSSGEKKTIIAWLDMGFGEEAISIAYDRTVAATGSYKPRYMNRILENWHGMGLHSPEEIAEKDSFRGSASSKAPSAGNSEKAIDDSILEKI